MAKKNSSEELNIPLQDLPILKMHEAAILLRISIKEIYRIAREEKWPIKRLGHAYTISRKFLNAWIDKQFQGDLGNNDQPAGENDSAA
jgi:hypothetical protein